MTGEESLERQCREFDGIRDRSQTSETSAEQFEHRETSSERFLVVDLMRSDGNESRESRLTESCEYGDCEKSAQHPPREYETVPCSSSIVSAASQSFNDQIERQASIISAASNTDTSPPSSSATAVASNALTRYLLDFEIFLIDSRSVASIL